MQCRAKKERGIHVFNWKQFVKICLGDTVLIVWANQCVLDNELS